MEILTCSQISAKNLFTNNALILEHLVSKLGFLDMREYEREKDRERKGREKGKREREERKGREKGKREKENRE